MGKERSAQLKVGIFVLVSIAIFVYGVFTISGQEELFEKEYTVKTYFDNTAGLLEGALTCASRALEWGRFPPSAFLMTPLWGRFRSLMEINKRALARVSTGLSRHDQDRRAFGGEIRRDSSRRQGESIGKGSRRNRYKGLHVARDAGDNKPVRGVRHEPYGHLEEPGQDSGGVCG